MSRHTLTKRIKGYDQYGHQVKLQFNDKGDAHKTLLGGLISIIVQVVLAAYFVSLLVKMGTYGDDKNLTTTLNSREKRDE